MVCAMRAANVLTSMGCDAGTAPWNQARRDPLTLWHHAEALPRSLACRAAMGSQASQALGALDECDEMLSPVFTGPGLKTGPECVGSVSRVF
eukprot:scaffold219442_cov18-Tisochrysis_lutea.AAC.1